MSFYIDPVSYFNKYNNNLCVILKTVLSKVSKIDVSRPLFKHDLHGQRRIWDASPGV